VGFISDLPTELVAAFRATLEEVLGADLIVHVRDISHADTEAQARDVETILRSLGVSEDRLRLEVWNKLDRLDAGDRDAVQARADRNADVFAVSALTGEGLPPLLAAIAEKLQGVRRQEELLLSFSDGRKRAWLHEEGVVEAEQQTDEGFRLTVLWTERQKARFRRL